MASILRIKEVIKEKGTTINELAKKMGINRVTLSNIINGDPKASTLQRIAKNLDVNVSDFYYTINSKYYTLFKNEISNNLNYKDEYFQLSSFLPHLTQGDGDYGNFKLDFINKNFSVVPTPKDIYDLVYADRSIDEIIYKNTYKSKIGVQLFSTYTYLSKIEYQQLKYLLELYKDYYKQLYQELMIDLGTLGYERTEFGSDYYKLGYISDETWRKLIAVTKKYDLSTSCDDIGKFNATGQNIILYTKNRDAIKMWVIKDEQDSFLDQFMLLWKAPSRYDRGKIKEGEILTAAQSYDYIFNTMLLD